MSRGIAAACTVDTLASLEAGTTVNAGRRNYKSSKFWGSVVQSIAASNETLGEGSGQRASS